MVTEAEIDEFLEGTDFEPYQAVPLPFGRTTPGHDLRQRADEILADRVRGKSVLDIGTFYGFFPYEAMRRGARSAVGVEARTDRVAVASRISELHGGTYDIVHGEAPELPFRDAFDVVLCLNVLHHVENPIVMLQRLAEQCRETMIIEFATPDDRRFVARQLAGRRGWGLAARATRRLRSSVLSWLIRVVDRHVALIGVGREPTRTFYVSPRALERLFTVHVPVFSNVEILPLSSTGRLIAVCHVRTGPDQAARLAPAGVEQREPVALVPGAGVVSSSTESARAH